MITAVGANRGFSFTDKVMSQSNVSCGAVGWIDKFKPSRQSQRPRGFRDDQTDPAAERTWSSRAKSTIPSAFPRFQSTAGDQLDPRLTDRFAEARMKLRTAYTPAQPVTDPRMFAGRTEVLTSLIRAIEHQRLHAVIYGERGIGKTSLVHVFTQAARDARYLVVYVPCGADSDMNEMFRALAAEVPLLFHSDYGPTSPEAERGASLADILPSVPITARLASDILAKIAGTRLLVLLDEFDRAESKQFRMNIAELVKNLSDRSVRVQIVIAGVAGNLTELIEYVPSIQRNVFAMQVPKMTAAEVRHLVQNGEDFSGVRFDDASIRYVVAVANGFPYLASLLSHHAGLAALDKGQMAVSVGEVSLAVNEALAEIKGRISKRSQIQIETAVREGAHKFLGPLSGVALSTGGEFSKDDMRTLFSTPESFSRCEKLIEHLASANILIEGREGESHEFFRFIEESVPSYLWIFTAQARFLESQTAASMGSAISRHAAIEM